MSKMTNYFVYHMPPGRLTIAADKDGICLVAFGDVPQDAPRRPSALTNTAANQLQEYFAHKRRVFDVPLSAQGTEFQLKGWNALQNIPYGQTRTYAEIAELVDNPKGFRAVGMANNKNPLPILVPCHRVIGTGGKLVGYAGGLKIKKFLLELEGVETESLK